MSAGMVRLSELSGRLHPPDDWLMAALTYRGTFDDSGDAEDPYHTCASLGGYVGPVDDWNDFETRWQCVLDEFEIPYLHMKEFGKPNGPYTHLLRDTARMASLFERFVEAIGKCRLTAFAAIVRVKDLKRFNRECGQNLQAYPLALQHCLGEIALQFPDVMMDIRLDRVPRPYAKIDRAIEYMAAHPTHPECFSMVENFGIAPLERGRTFRNVRALQAADFLAWETRKSAHTNDEYLSNLKPNRTQDEWYRDMMIWSMRRQLRQLSGQITLYKPGDATGEVRDLPIGERKSFELLSEKSPVSGGILDYHYMSEQNKLRNGIWSYPPGVAG